jgi:uncharacterized coiled-coil DUF342 family protein
MLLGGKSEAENYYVHDDWTCHLWRNLKIKFWSFSNNIREALPNSNYCRRRFRNLLLTEMDDLTKEELLEAYEEADLKIEELTDHIQELEQENVKLKRKIKTQGGGGGGESDDMDDVLNAAALEAANEELRNKLATSQADCLKLKEKNDELASYAKVYKDEKAEAEASIRSLRKKVDDLQDALAESEKSMRSTMQKSTEFTKQKKDTKRAQMQLYEENEQLQLEVNLRIITPIA